MILFSVSSLRRIWLDVKVEIIGSGVLVLIHQKIKDERIRSMKIVSIFKKYFLLSK